MLPIGKEMQHLSRHNDATLIHSKTFCKGKEQRKGEKRGIRVFTAQTEMQNFIIK
jgi:hypothetical protein